MKFLVFVAAFLGFATTAQAQSPAPDLRGTWTGASKSIVVGSNSHHPGERDAPPRVRDFEFTFVIEGQDGPLLWGHHFSKAAPAARERFAWSMSHDGRRIFGADQDGYYQMTLESADLIEMCYAHSQASPSSSLVAACFMIKRVAR
jgi:hypothetical protein